MGAWGSGPFENDAAADLLGSLEGQGAAEWADGLRQTLATAAESHGYLDYDDGGAAVAAAAIVASARGPVEGLADEELPDIPRRSLLWTEELRDLGARALDRVVGEDSEWQALWAEGTGDDEAFASVRQIRSALAGG
jgi:hypothetical protein